MKTMIVALALIAVSAMGTNALAGDRYHQAGPPDLTPEEMKVFQKRAAHLLGRPLDDYVFQGHQRGPVPPRPDCIFDKKVNDPAQPGLHHAGWRCPRLGIPTS